MRGVFSPRQMELVCSTAPRVRPHSARLVPMDRNQGKRQQVQPVLNHSSGAALAEPSLTSTPCSQGHKSWAVEGLVGTVLPSLPMPVGTEMGAGPGGFGGFLGVVQEGQGEGLCRGGRHHVDCTIKRERDVQIKQRGGAGMRKRGLV